MLRPLAVLLMAAYAARFFYPIFPSPYLEVFQRSDKPLYLNLARWAPLFHKSIRNEHEHRSTPGFSRMYLVEFLFHSCRFDKSGASWHQWSETRTSRRVGIPEREKEREREKNDTHFFVGEAPCLPHCEVREVQHCSLSRASS